MSKQKTWQIGLKAAAFNQIKNMTGFHQIIALARIANAMRFVQVAALHASGNKSPSGSRQSFNSFLYRAAILWEGIPLVQRMARTFRHYAAFREFGRLLADGTTQGRLDRLKPLRNQAAFHFDESAVRSALVGDIGMDTPFASGHGTKSLDTYYSLADFAALRLLAPECHSEKEFRKE